MNIKDIRLKYPQYNDLSDEELLTGIHQKFYSDMPKDEFLSKFSENTNKKTEWTPEMEQKYEYLKSQTPKTSALRDFGEGFVKGVAGGAERVASGATLGAYDWASDKLGLGVKERKKELYELTGTPGKVIGTGLEIVGGFGPSAKIAKGTAAGLKAIPKVGAGVAKIATIPLSGGIESAIQTGFDTDSLSGAAKGFGYGTALSSLIGGGLGAGRKLFSTRTATKGVKGGLENAVKSSAGARLLSRGVGASDDVASMIRQQGQEALEETNKRTLKALDTAIGQRTSVSDEMAKAKKAYADFIDERKAIQVIEGKPKTTKSVLLDARGNQLKTKTNSIPTSKDIGLTDLSKYQQNALDEAWNKGAMQLKANEKIGSLKHLDEMKKQLNNMISDTQTQKVAGIGLQDTADTVALRELKGKLKGVMDNSGLTDISKQYAQAKNLQNAYDLGLNYNAGAVKTRKLPFSTQAEKQAFADGLIERISMGTDTKNVSKAILDNQRVLKEVLPEKKVIKLLRVAGENETAYGRIEQLGRKAETKLRTPEANRLFAREQGETRGALFGSILDYLNDKARAGVFTRGSKRVLNPNFVPKTGLRIGDILTPEISSDIISKNINIGEE